MTDFKRELDDLIVIVAKEGASDLHLTVGGHPTIRVSGDLIPIVKKPILTADDTMGMVMEVLSEENQKLFLRNKEIDFSYSLPEGIRFRCNAFFQRGFVCVAFRLIPIEDPIEYMFTNDRSIIDQREVRFDTQDFSTALRSMFRQDVNVAMIGEMRNPETISTAVTAAETGHLILSTLHTNSAAQTVDRIIDSFPANQQRQIRVQLAGSLIGIFSQRLVPRVSGGLIPAHELLLNNTAVANLIREGRSQIKL